MNISLKLTVKTAVFCLGIALLGSCSDKNDPKDQAENVNDKKFSGEEEKAADKLVNAYSSNLYEIKVSENAITKASTADVKKLAGMLVAAHTKMNTDVQKLAESKNVTLPGDLSDDQRQKIEKLSGKTGLDYDKEYTKEMRDKHESAVKTYEKISDKCDDPDIKHWAAQTLPEVRSHLDMVESTWNNIKDMKEDKGMETDHQAGNNNHHGTK